MFKSIQKAVLALAAVVAIGFSVQAQAHDRHGRDWRGYGPHPYAQRHHRHHHWKRHIRHRHHARRYHAPRGWHRGRNRTRVDIHINTGFRAPLAYAPIAVAPAPVIHRGYAPLAVGPAPIIPRGYAPSGARPNFGNAVGGAVGGLIGAQVGKGSGQLAATAAGAVMGYMIGGELAAPY